MKVYTGTISILQEDRFWLVDDEGVSHHFTVAHDALLPITSLALLQRENARLLVHYREIKDVITNEAHQIEEII